MNYTPDNLEKFVRSLVEKEHPTYSIETIEEKDVEDYSLFSVFFEEHNQIQVGLVDLDDGNVPVHACVKRYIEANTSVPVASILSGGKVRDIEENIFYYVEETPQGTPIESFSEIEETETFFTQLGEYMGELHANIILNEYGDLSGEPNFSITVSEGETQVEQHREEVENSFREGGPTFSSYADEAITYFEENSNLFEEEETPSFVNPQLKLTDIYTNEEGEIVSIEGWENVESGSPVQQLSQIQLLFIESNIEQEPRRQTLRNSLYMGYQRKAQLGPKFTDKSRIYELITISKSLTTDSVEDEFFTKKLDRILRKDTEPETETTEEVEETEEPEEEVEEVEEPEEDETEESDEETESPEESEEAEETEEPEEEEEVEETEEPEEDVEEETKETEESDETGDETTETDEEETDEIEDEIEDEEDFEFLSMGEGISSGSSAIGGGPPGEREDTDDETEEPEKEEAEEDEEAEEETEESDEETESPEELEEIEETEEEPEEEVEETDDTSETEDTEDEEDITDEVSSSEDDMSMDELDTEMEDDEEEGDEELGDDWLEGELEEDEFEGEGDPLFGDDEDEDTESIFEDDESEGDLLEEDETLDWDEIENDEEDENTN